LGQVPSPGRAGVNATCPRDRPTGHAAFPIPGEPCYIPRMPARRAVPVLFAVAPLMACGGGSPSGPSGTPSPTPTPDPGFSVVGVVFYDENANGTLDADEQVRLPSVTVRLGGRSGQSEAGGRVVVNAVPSGSQAAAIDERSLPPYFVPGAMPAVLVPQQNGSTLTIPVTLPIGGNHANVYLAFGDSISAGEGSSSGDGYLVTLRDRLVARWGAARVEGEGQSATRSNQGLARLSAVLWRVRPAYTLILYGTNDWNRTECRTDFPCFTIDSLSQMIRVVRGNQGLPVVGTIPPVNPAAVDRSPVERNAWVVRMNDLIRPMVTQEGAALADIHAAFMSQPSLEPLFADHVHPNEEGYLVIAEEFFGAITRSRGPTAASSSWAWAASSPLGSLFFEPGDLPVEPGVSRGPIERRLASSPSPMGAGEGRVEPQRR